jgi:hypothetical protein
MCFTFIFFTKYGGDPVGEDEVDGKCDIYGKDEKCIQNINWKIRREDTTCKITQIAA